MAPEPLPTAPNRAAFANRINMLCSNRSSLWSSMNPSSPSSSTPNTQPKKSTTASKSSSKQHRQPVEEDNDHIRYVDEDAGVGYVRPSAASGGTPHDATSKQKKAEDDALRGRILGRGGRRGESQLMMKKKAAAAAAAESSEDEDEGRGSLGKRKRPRRAHGDRGDEAGGGSEGGVKEGVEEEEARFGKLWPGGAVDGLDMGEVNASTGLESEPDDHGGKAHDAANVSEMPNVLTSASMSKKKRKRKKKNKDMKADPAA